MKNFGLLHKMGGTIRIAIIGGGLAGVLIAICLARKLPLADIQVFESGTERSQRGLGIGFSRIALQALEQIVPSAAELLKSDAGAVKIGASRIVIVRITLSIFH